MKIKYDDDLVANKLRQKYGYVVFYMEVIKMKIIVNKWDKTGGKGIFVLNQSLSNVCKSVNIKHINW